MLVDLGIGVSVNSTAPDLPGGPTVELTVVLAGVPHADARHLELDGQAVSVTATSGVGRSEIRDDTGQVIAHVTGVMATAVGPAAPRDVTPSSLFDPRAVTLEPAGGDDHPAQGRVALDDSMLNSRGVVHGGVLAGIAMLAQERFDESGAREGLSLAIHYLRPAHPSLGHLDYRCQYVRRGRSFRTVRTTLTRPDGVVVAEATATAAIPVER
jgi:acyl-coenzyme A thioesterase PaaI-like protein